MRKPRRPLDVRAWRLQRARAGSMSDERRATSAPVLLTAEPRVEVTEGVNAGGEGGGRRIKPLV